MSFASIKIRALWLSLLLLAPLAGCTEFQTMTTSKWLDGHWLKGDSSTPVNDMLTVWDCRVKMIEDHENDGMQRPGLVGRLVLLSGSTFAEANGGVIVTVVDLTHPEPDKAPEKLGEWKFSAEALKQLRRRDPLGDGYTLFLPWPNYTPATKEVEVRLCYVPEKGARRYSTPNRLHLQNDDSMQPVFRERQVIPGQPPQPQIVPASLTPTLGRY